MTPKFDNDFQELIWSRAEFDRLRAELDSLQAQIEQGHCLRDRLRAELADATFAHQCAERSYDWAFGEKLKAEARLAAVIALCDATHGADARLYAARVRAAAMGETK